ncbi:MAG: FkbM family methyltransferase [Chlamydiia bacterium]|nr:FkbM family methyltransferase [Chlamydiia bacterium]
MSHILSDTTLIRRSRLRQLKERENAFWDLEFIKAMPADKRSRCVDLLATSPAQVRQDIFALAMLDFPQDGFFVEFGATNGTELSNTHMLERDFGWTGILCEPAAGWHTALKSSRKAIIDTRCVWSESGAEVQFTEAPSAINSGISTFVKTSRKVRGRSYAVETVSLNDLLAQHNAPAMIDFISIDTEGSEYDILSTVDFDRWSFRVMTVEHNHEPQRDQVVALLTSKGYRRVFEAVSRFDDWYVLDA